MVETRLFCCREAHKVRRKAIFHAPQLSEISSYGGVTLSEHFGDTSVSPNHGVVVPVLCEAGVDTAYDGSRILSPRVTSQAVKLRLATNRPARLPFSRSFASYNQTRPANARRFVASIDLMALPEGAGGSTRVPY